jgi:hypothetical protein
VEYEFNTTGELFEWRGPAPFYFVRVDAENSSEIKKLAAVHSYGWGVVYIHGEILNLEFQTALIPKDGRYLIPIKNEVRKKLDLQLDDEIEVTFSLGKKQ